MTALSSDTLRRLRLERGWSQTHTGGLAGVSRQGYAAIETGKSIPSTEVALRLARAFGRSVEELFRLTDDEGPEQVLDAAGPRPFLGHRVRVARIAGREVAHRLDAGGAHVQTPADGTGDSLPDGRVRMRRFGDAPRAPDLVVAGCDPSFGLVADLLRREHGLDVLRVPAGSRAALDALRAGTVHVAGVHLRDPETGRYNGPWIRRLVPGATTRVTYAVWEQVLVTRSGNPLGVGGVEDLARAGLRFVNREAGSGSRALVELLLAEAGVPQDAVPGFHQTAADGHMAVAGAVSAGTADAGVAIRAAALARDLHAVPLGAEPYELVIPNHFLELPAVGALLTALRRPDLRRQIEALGGYDAAAMGMPA